MGRVAVEERGEGVLLATLDNPPHAVMDRAMVAELEALGHRAERDPDVTGIVITGAHPERFVAHYEVAELLDGAKASPSVGRNAAHAALSVVAALRRVPGAADAVERTPAAGVSAVERLGEVLTRFERAGAVVVAALNGSAMGGGCELALASDLRLMADGPFLIGQPEMLLGFPPGGGGTQRLTRLLGTGPAVRLCLDGGALNPSEAAEVGLVDELAPSEQLLERAMEHASRLARRPKAAIAGVKRAVYQGGSLPLGAGLRLERAQFMSCLGTPEALEAMAAYVEATERTGDLPLYDRAAREQALEDGRFGRPPGG